MRFLTFSLPMDSFRDLNEEKSGNQLCTTKQAQKVLRFTCLKCRRDLNFGPGISSSFVSSHRKSWPSSFTDWCRDFEDPPSAPSQQLISSSCSFGTTGWYQSMKSDEDICFLLEVHYRYGEFHRKIQEKTGLLSQVCILSMTWCASHLSKAKMKLYNLTSNNWQISTPTVIECC